MAEKIYDKIKNRIASYEAGEVFFTTDFKDMASLPTIRKCLGRQVEEGNIRRVLDGTYEKPRFSKVIQEYLPADPEKVANAIAQKYHWTISPCGDIALNKLGLSTQVPAKWEYCSSGPYRNYEIGNITLCFKHGSNKEIEGLSYDTALLVQAIKAVGKDNISEDIILRLRERTDNLNKDIVLQEARYTTSWVFSVIKKICERETKQNV